MDTHDDENHLHDDEELSTAFNGSKKQQKEVLARVRAARGKEQNSPWESPFEAVAAINGNGHTCWSCASRVVAGNETDLALILAVGSTPAKLADILAGIPPGEAVWNYGFAAVAVVLDGLAWAMEAAELIGHQHVAVQLLKQSFEDLTWGTHSLLFDAPSRDLVLDGRNFPPRAYELADSAHLLLSASPRAPGNVVLMDLASLEAPRVFVALQSLPEAYVAILSTSPLEEVRDALGANHGTATNDTPIPPNIANIRQLLAVVHPAALLERFLDSARQERYGTLATDHIEAEVERTSNTRHEIMKKYDRLRHAKHPESGTRH